MDTQTPLSWEPRRVSLGGHFVEPPDDTRLHWTYSDPLAISNLMTSQPLLRRTPFNTY